MEYKIESTEKEITPWSGILLLINMLDKMRLDKCLSSLDLPRQGSNRGYNPIQLIKQFMTSIWCGANRFEHTEVTRQDEVIRHFGDLSEWRDTRRYNDFLRSLIFRPNFIATEAALNFLMIAYNIISLFRQVIIKTKINERLKTLRYRVFAIGGYLVKNGNQRILKLSLAMKRREWFTGLWLNTNNLKSPPTFVF